jgi:hypothetical protein
MRWYGRKDNNMKSFEEVWAKTGYNYGENALENVKLGWELAIKEVANHLEQFDRDLYNNKMRDGESFRTKLNEIISKLRTMVY